MKKRKLALALIIILCLCGNGCYLMWARYANREYGFSILLPRMWQREEGFQNTVVISRAPLSGPKDKTQASINIVVVELPQETALDIFFEVNKEEALRVLPGIKENLLEGEIWAGREKGRILAFNTKIGGFNLRTMVAMWMKEKRVYIVTCSGEVKEFEQYNLLFKTMLHSLRID